MTGRKSVELLLVKCAVKCRPDVGRRDCTSIIRRAIGSEVIDARSVEDYGLPYIRSQSLG